MPSALRLKERLPADLLAFARMARTALALTGLLEPAERRKRRLAFQRLRRLTRAAVDGPRVLVLSFRGWYPHSAWEAVLAHALRLRGARVHVFNCGGRLPICEVNFRHAASRIACAECAAYPRHVVSELQLPRSWLHDYVAPGEMEEVARAIGRLTPEEYPEWTFDAQPVGRLVRDSVAWFLRKAEPTLHGRDASVYRDFLIAGTVVSIAAPRLLSAVRPEIVLELNGRFFAERIVNRYVARTATIVAYEAGWRSDTLSFERVAGCGPDDLDTAWKSVADRPLSAREEHDLDTWLSERASGDMQRDFYISFAPSRPANIIAQLGLESAKPTAVLFTNVVWDTGVLGRTVAFPSVANWVQTTVEAFRRWPDRQLIIRVHPAEELRPSQESAEKIADLLAGMIPLPPNVHVLPARDPASTFALMEGCTVGLVYTSTAGLEMALRRKPVVVVARATFRGRGFTVDIDRASEYVEAVELAFAKRRLDEVEFALARRFAYLLFFRYLHPIPVVRQRPRRFPVLEPEDTGRIAPGADEDFDRLMHSILTGGQLIRV